MVSAHEPTDSSTQAEDVAQRQAEDTRARGFRCEAHGERVLMPVSDFGLLIDSVRADPRLDAIGRGWYLNGNGNMILTPDWPWNLTRVAMLRLIAVAVYRPLRPLVRFLSTRTSR